MVRAGETGGFLDLVLEQIATFRSREQDLKNKVTSAMLYPTDSGGAGRRRPGVPADVLHPAVLADVRRLRRLAAGADQGHRRPPAISWCGTGSSWCSSWPWRCLGFAGRWPARRAAASWSGSTLRLPVFGQAVSRFALVRFCRMLGTLVGAGVPLVAALRVAKEAIGNQVLADAVDVAIEDVQRGTPLARSLESCRCCSRPR